MIADHRDSITKLVERTCEPAVHDPIRIFDNETSPFPSLDRCDPQSCDG